jgi:GNAT superfamily N-acetyltransferase
VTARGGDGGDRTASQPGDLGARASRPVVGEASGAGPVVREARAEEDSELRAVLASCFPSNPKARAEVTAWQYWENPFGPTRVRVCEDRGRLVGTYAAFRVPGAVDGRPSPLAIGVDAAVLPGYRGRGLFARMARALEEDLGRDGVPFTLGYPSDPASTRSLEHAGWTQVGRLATFVLGFDPGFVAARFRLPGRLAALACAVAFGRRGAGVGAGEVDAVPAGVDELWESCASFADFGIVRTAAFLRWRYERHPDRPYRFFEARAGGRLRGTAVTVERSAFGGRFVYLLELLAEDVVVARALVGAVADAVLRGATSGEAAAPGAPTGLAPGSPTGLAPGAPTGLAAVALPGSRLAALVSAAGLRRVPRILEPKPFRFGAARNDAAAPDPRGRAWWVSWGDLDHV